MKCVYIAIFFFTSHLLLPAQNQTVGLFYNSEIAFNGYALFNVGQKNVVLLDNCGEYVHYWSSPYVSGNTFYLLESGHLLRCAKINSIPSFALAGGAGGGIEMWNWEGDLVWFYEYAEPNSHYQHHDVEYLPNGNLLILAWQWHTAQEAINLGKENIVPNQWWTTQIVEVIPIFPDSATIVWEWNIFDHLIQDIDSTFANYGQLSEHPERMDINLGIATQSDWLHCNAIEYIAEYDQIAVSAKYIHEVFVIDHSTTSEEAAGTSGGTYGKGGDLLYRWGNPQNYNRGNLSDQLLFDQHDVSWIPDTVNNGGVFQVFNNNANLALQISSAVAWKPPLDSLGFYIGNDSMSYGPYEFYWEYIDTGQMYASAGSSNRRLPNGNQFICEAGKGRMHEVTWDKELVWEYQNPIGSNDTLSQGESLSIDGLGSFRAEKYPPNYPAFYGRTLEPLGPLELNPWDTLECILTIDTNYQFEEMDSTIVDTLYTELGDEFLEEKYQVELYIWPQPANDRLFINIDTNFSFQIFSMDGVELASGKYESKGIDVSSIKGGIHLLYLSGYEPLKLVKF